MEIIIVQFIKKIKLCSICCIATAYQSNFTGNSNLLQKYTPKTSFILYCGLMKHCKVMTTNLILFNNIIVVLNACHTLALLCCFMQHIFAEQRSYEKSCASFVLFCISLYSNLYRISYFANTGILIFFVVIETINSILDESDWKLLGKNILIKIILYLFNLTAYIFPSFICIILMFIAEYALTHRLSIRIDKYQIIEGFINKIPFERKYLIPLFAIMGTSFLMILYPILNYSLMLIMLIVVYDCSYNNQTKDTELEDVDALEYP